MESTQKRTKSTTKTKNQEILVNSAKSKIQICESLGISLAGISNEDVKKVKFFTINADEGDVVCVGVEASDSNKWNWIWNAKLAQWRKSKKMSNKALQNIEDADAINRINGIAADLNVAPFTISNQPTNEYD